ncbi:hypothetical protein HVIM_04261 [Roseomonas mucosa]|nr:hypothetical protein HVIM_04261 [Roseomonas mucosa]
MEDEDMRLLTGLVDSPPLVPQAGSVPAALSERERANQAAPDLVPCNRLVTGWSLTGT